MAGGAKVFESVILGAGALIAIYYGVTHQDQLKMYFNKFIMSAQSQLSGGMNMGMGMGTMPAAGDNTSGSDNTPAVGTTTTPASTDNTSDTPPITPPAPTAVTQGDLQSQFPNIPPSVLGTVTPIAPSSVNMPTPPATDTGDQTLDTPSVPDNNANNPLTAPFNQPNSGQGNIVPSGTNTGRPMKNMKAMAPRNSQAVGVRPNNTGGTPIAPQQNVQGNLQAGINALNKKQPMNNPTGVPTDQPIQLQITGPTPQQQAAQQKMMMMDKIAQQRKAAQDKRNMQIQSAIRSNRVLVGANKANQFCICGSGGKWSGPGCNVGGTYCSSVGAHGSGK